LVCPGSNSKWSANSPAGHPSLPWPRRPNCRRLASPAPHSPHSHRGLAQPVSSSKTEPHDCTPCTQEQLPKCAGKRTTRCQLRQWWRLVSSKRSLSARYAREPVPTAKISNGRSSSGSLGPRSHGCARRARLPHDRFTGGPFTHKPKFRRTSITPPASRSRTGHA